MLHAPTGSGKTTRVPPALLDAGLAGDRQVVVLEPRRIAARAVARRIAEERGGRLGDEVGYQVRFQRVASARTRLLVVTEGLLLRMIQADPFLESVGVVVFDEFHERNLHTDLGLALCRAIQRDVRPDLNLVVMSATLDSERLSSWLEAPVVRTEGRTFPVATRHIDRLGERSIEDWAATSARQFLDAPGGHILVFLPGMREIRQVASRLQGVNAAVLPLHGSLTPDEQDSVFADHGRRKIILATNIAETSLTIPGVTAVVDSGLARVLRYDPNTGLDELDVERISQASAAQRAGRAGRDGPGECLRLWTAAAHEQLDPFDTPEIQRVDLAPSVLQLLEWGVADPQGFGWFEPPDPAATRRAIEGLTALGAVEQGGVTPLGRRLTSLPLHPRLGRLVHQAHALGHLRAGATVAALLSERDLFRPELLRSRPGSDSPSHSDVWDRYTTLDGRSARFRRDDLHRLDVQRVQEAARQIERAATDTFGTQPAARGSEEDAVLRSVMAGYIDRLAVLRPQEPGRGVLLSGRGVRAGIDTAVKDEAFFVCVAFETGRGIRGADWNWSVASGVERAWIPADLFERQVEHQFDDARGRVVAVETERLAGVLVSTRPTAIRDAEKAASLLAAAAAADPMRALGADDPAVAQRLARLRFAAHHMPDQDFPHPDLLKDRWQDLCTGLRGLDELRASKPVNTLWDLLRHEQRRLLEEEVPAKLEVPSGSEIAIDYSDIEAPILAVRIQEVFGLLDTPRVARGKVPLTLHLLAPNYRPQQVTRDLRSFWSGTYHEVRRELRQRYPKHSWPDDPFTARAERGPRRRSS